MGNSLILEFYKNRVHSIEDVLTTENLEKNIKLLWKYGDMLDKMLNEEQKAMLALYNEMQFAVDDEQEDLAFIEGFKTGMKIALECLVPKETKPKKTKSNP